jgi:DNA topoisomerase-1
MSNAIYDTLSIDTVSAGHIFRANHQSLKFPGFIAVYEEGKDDETEEKDTPLPNLQEGETVLLGGHEKLQHFTQPPARYTEATLVKAMEEKGVGRPSTYATTVSTILDREYVIKTDKRLSPTPLGEVVTGLMKERFTDVIDVAFTAHMEERLDQVETGDVYWKQVLRDFYQIFHQEMEDAEVALEGVRLKVPDEVTEEICELCGRNMVIKSGRFGRFLACPGYPECKNTKPLAEHMPGRCPKCGSGMLKRKSQRGYAYYACEKGKDCGFMSWEVPTAEDCPYCGKTLFKKSGKGQKKMFCINPECENFTPEELRGYRKKKTEEAQTEQTDAAEAKETVAAEAVPEKKTKKTTKKAAEKSSEKKTAAKKTTKKAAAEDKPAKKTTKKTAEKKTAAKKTTAKKATTKKTTTAKKTKKQPEAEEA